jgi:hypothetical protein
MSMVPRLSKPAWPAVLLGLFMSATLNASEWHVTTSGTAGGDGSLANPWNLTTAIAKTTVLPGDTVWVHGGTYPVPAASSFQSTLNGTAANQIIVRNWNNERAILDGAGGYPAVLVLYGSYTTWWGFEVWSSTMDHGIGSNIPNGVTAYAPGVKCVNCVIHDTAGGLLAYNLAPDSEYYGNVIYQNGVYGIDRQHGHGVYMQNVTGLKYLDNNFCGDNAMEGFQIYGGGNANVDGFRFDGNTIYNNSSWPGLTFQYGIIDACGGTRKNHQWRNTVTYFSDDTGYGSQFGLWTDGDDMDIQNNVFVGGDVSFGVALQRGPVTLTGNKIVHYPGAGMLLC